MRSQWREQKKEAHRHFVRALDLTMGIFMEKLEVSDLEAAKKIIKGNGNIASDILFGDVQEGETLTLTVERGRAIRDTRPNFGQRMGEYKQGLELIFGGVKANNPDQERAILARYEEARKFLFGVDVVKLRFG